MTNPKQKTVACILLILIIGVGLYNIYNPYEERTKSQKTSNNSVSKTPVAKNNVSSSSSDRSPYNSASSYASNNNNKRTPSKNDLLLKEYRDNALWNGAQPYSDFYGYNSTYGNSEIRVNASSNSDVIVIIKRRNSDGPVERHAYITKGSSYTFTIPAGTYQTFFYYGKSWCPVKEMSGGITGGFLESEVFSKDDPLYINDYEILTYSLTLQRNGNFRTDPSSENEIF